MADEKKTTTEVAGIFDPHPDPFVHIIWLVLVGLIILYAVNAFINMLLSASAYRSSLPGFFRQVIIFVFWFFTSWVFKIIAVIVALLCIYGMAVWLRKLWILRAEDRKRMYPEPEPMTAPIHPQWQRIEDHLQSPNENDWRQAIMEADIMLDDILDKMDLPGETMGDKLKAVDKGAFLTLDNAWEAHRARNQIAHEGSAYVLTGREAKRIIELYKTVFEEFQVI